jgi:hypothetical protein
MFRSIPWKQFRLFAFLACLLLLASDLFASGMPTLRIYPWLEPTDYTSESGRYILRVDPDDRYGAGGADYEMRLNGEIIWSVRHEFALWDAAVTDDGRTVGFAYSKGYDPIADYDSEDDGLGTLSVIALDGNGMVVFREDHLRYNDLFSIGGDSPFPFPYVLNAEFSNVTNQLLIHIGKGAKPIRRSNLVRRGSSLEVVLVDDMSPTGQELWLYDMDSYERTIVLSEEQIHPDFSIDHGRQRFRGFHQITPIPDKPLWLLRCMYYTETDNYLENTAGYAILDRDGKLVWKEGFHLPGVKPDLDTRLEPAMTRRSTNCPFFLGIREVTSDGFLFELPKHEQLLRFEILENDDKEGPERWTIRESGRTSYDLSESFLPMRADPFESMELSCPELPVIELRLNDASTSSIVSNVSDFAVDDNGNICFLKASSFYQTRDVPPAFVYVNQEGELLHEFDLSLYKSDTTFRASNVVRLGHARFGFIMEGYWDMDGNHNGKMFIADFEEKTLHFQEIEDCHNASQIVSFRDGEIIVLNGGSKVFCLDNRGHLKWRKKKSSDPLLGGYNYTENIVVCNDQQIELIASNGEISTFSRAGVYLSTKSYDKDPRFRYPGYQSHFFSSSKGYLLACERNGAIAIIETDPELWMLTEHVVKYENGRLISKRGGFDVAPDGSYWISDGDSIYRLDQETYLVDLVVGRAINSDVLDAPANVVAIGPDDTIHIADRRSFAVHAFSSDGTHLSVQRLDPLQIPLRHQPRDVTVTNEGETFTRGGYSDTYLRLSNDGRPGVVPSMPLMSERRYREPRVGTWLFSLNSDCCWVVGMEGIYLTDMSGEILVDIQRGLSNHWLSVGGVATSSDGRLVALTYERTLERIGFHTFAPNGEPLTFSPLNELGVEPLDFRGFMSDQYDKCQISFDRERVFILRNRDVHVWSTDGEPIGKISIADEDESMSHYDPHVSKDGTELWLVDGIGLQVRRFDISSITN